MSEHVDIGMANLVEELLSPEKRIILQMMLKAQKMTDEELQVEWFPYLSLRKDGNEAWQEILLKELERRGLPSIWTE